MHDAKNGLASALAEPQAIEVQSLIEIAYGVDGRIHTQIKIGPTNRPLINMLLTTAHQDLLTKCALAERQAAKGPGIAIAPPGSEVERNPKA